VDLRGSSEGEYEEQSLKQQRLTSDAAFKGCLGKSCSSVEAEDAGGLCESKSDTVGSWKDLLMTEGCVAVDRPVRCR
jgi:hypothetical protein